MIQQHLPQRPSCSLVFITLDDFMPSTGLSPRLRLLVTTLKSVCSSPPLQRFSSRPSPGERVLGEQSPDWGRAAFPPQRMQQRAWAGAERGLFACQTVTPSNRANPLPVLNLSSASLIIPNGRRSCVVGSCPLSLGAMDKEYPCHTRAGPPWHTEPETAGSSLSFIFPLFLSQLENQVSTEGQGGPHCLGSVLEKAVSDLSLLGSDPLPRREGLVGPQVHR